MIDLAEETEGLSPSPTGFGTTGRSNPIGGLSFSSVSRAPAPPTLSQLGVHRP